MKIQSIYIILLLSFISITSLFAQEKKKIEIVYAGRLNVEEEQYPGARVLTRDESQQVHIMQGSINMWSDKAIYYSGENFIEAYGNVKLIEGDTIHMTSKYIEYSGITQLAFASGGVILKDPNSTISSDTLYYDRVKQQAFYKNGGTVVKDTSGTITSKIGRYYMEQKKYQFVDDVVLVNKDATINSNYFDFYSDTGYAYLYGPSTIVTTESKTYTEKGFYDTKNRSGYTVKKSEIHYNNRIIEGDSIYFDDNKKFASATNNIKVTDTINHSIAKGHYAEVFKAQDSLFITKRALIATKQENDSIYMHADKIMMTGKPENRIVRAYYNAKIFKSDISGKADSIHSNQKTGLTQLINLQRFSSVDKFSKKRRPILWNVENQMTGDSIHLISNPKTEKLDSLLVFNNAFVISKDTISKDGYNQIFGIRLTGLFNDENKLRKVNIDKNAESIFYARNENQELIGIDKARSGSISILFADGDIEEYTRFNQVDGNLYPESKYPKNEKLLKGFDWREDERPLSVEDLFKDDEPLQLPIIKGLEDYIPQDAFFDEELLERVKLAGQGYIVNRAAQNIPQDETTIFNLLKSSSDLSNSVWEKNDVRLKINSEISPNGKKLATTITGLASTNNNGSVVQIIEKKVGNFIFSVWLKGTGSKKIIFQEQGGDFTVYNFSNINLTNEWKKYSLIAEKVNDGGNLRCIINEIKENETISVWNPMVSELTKK
ncbi:OstA-like protein [Mariniflexile gromovii]|uniref:LPS export ABC transporter periplasmic protein LptC n=1 Tax=Mariniflexile gromovii TaxID=362523 RepID=A0ABS4BT94_9FLAO|nr:OstA-like protein [Mariniflexile gromovii]MBP0903813.1 LPS export ABC transporter periplasmic protein LptC [Mariniflexile gromovii]